MKKTILFLFLLVTALVFSGCCLKHERVIDAAVSPTCTENGLTGGEHCAKCEKIFIAQETIPATGHKETKDDAVAPTCTETGLTEGKHCSVCGEILNVQTVIEALGHMEIVDVAVPETCTEDGLTEGKHCSVCGEVLLAQKKIEAHHVERVLVEGFDATCAKPGVTSKTECSVCGILLSEQVIIEKLGHNMVDGTCTTCGKAEIDFTDVDLYAGDYAYRYLASLKNGEAMQRVYESLDKQMKQFHVSNQNAIVSDNRYIVATLNFANYGISSSEMEQIRWYYYYDHPLYYWMTGQRFSEDGKSISILTEPEYADGNNRKKYNNIIYQGVKKYISIISNDSSFYEIALAYHDEIIKNCYYEYNWSEKVSSVLGGFESNSVQCVGYAKMFQILLNVSGVDNIYIRGQTSGGNHAWNLVRLDDGNWYWFDLTWDDIPSARTGIQYDYFCKTDSSFTSNHKCGKDVLGLYDLPSRSKSNFNMPEILVLNETFTVDGYTYVLVGYNEVKLIKVENLEHSAISKVITYAGNIYTITDHN